MYKNHIISTANERLTSGFRTPQRPTHDGCDFTDMNRKELKENVYILAFADGVVCDTTVGASIGYSVSIAHEGKILTRYFHMKPGSVRVKKGDKVNKGHIIGVMGTSGQSTGIHLHFAVKENSTNWNNGVYVNPEPYLNGEKVTGGKKPQEVQKPAGNAALKAGDKVKVLNAVTYDGKPFKVWHAVYDVLQVSGDRVVIGVKDIGTTAAVKAGNLAKV